MFEYIFVIITRYFWDNFDIYLLGFFRIISMANGRYFYTIVMIFIYLIHLVYFATLYLSNIINNKKLLIILNNIILHKFLVKLITAKELKILNKL